MNVSFLLESTDVSAVARTTLAYADALVRRGMRVRIVTADEPPRWRPSFAEWVYVDELRAVDASGDDFLVATSAATAQLAAVREPRRAVQLCFGNEEPSSFALAMPRLAASGAALETVQRFAPDVALGGIAVDDEVHARGERRESEPPRLLLCGASQRQESGVEDGYGAVAHARWFHQKVDLIRVSPWAPSREEPLDWVQEFHVGLTSAELARLMHSCDVAVAPGWSEQTFALTPAESLAAGLALVATDTRAHAALASERTFALFAPERNAVELGERLIELLGDPELRGRLRSSAREAARQWTLELVGERLERFFGGLR